MVPLQHSLQVQTRNQQLWGGNQDRGTGWASGWERHQGFLIELLVHKWSVFTLKFTKLLMYALSYACFTFCTKASTHHPESFSRDWQLPAQPGDVQEELPARGCVHMTEDRAEEAWPRLQARKRPWPGDNWQGPGRRATHRQVPIQPGCAGSAETQESRRPRDPLPSPHRSFK